MPESIQTPEEGTENVEQPTQTPAEPRQQTPPPPPPPPPQEETVESLKEKLSHSANENRILREAEEARKKAEQELTKEPTDSDLRAAFPEWDGLDDFQKNIARRTFNSERTAQRAAQTTEQLTAERSWSTSVELAVSSNPSLQGKEQAFRQYASKPQYRNVPMDVLVSAFLQKNGGEPPKPTPRPGLEPGRGGPRTPEKTKTTSADDLATLRNSDPKAYAEYIKTHKVDDIDLT